MNDQQGEGLSRQARALIAIGREGDQPSAQDRARVRAKLIAGIAGTATAIAAAKTSAAGQLAAGSSATAAPATMAGTSATAGAGLISAKVGAGVLAIALATAGAAAVGLHVSQRAPAAERQHVGLALRAGETAPAAETRAGTVPGLSASAHSQTVANPRTNVAARADELAVEPEPAEPEAAVGAAPTPTPTIAPAAALRGAQGASAIESAQPALVRAPRESLTRSTRSAARAKSRRAANAASARKLSVASSSAPASATPAQTSAPALTATDGDQTDSGTAPALRGAPSLRRELTLIAAAQAALARNAPEEALRWLDAHAAGYASGELVQERLAARAVALCALGRDAEGKRAASDLARLAPHSPLLGRARRACAADPQ